MPRSVLADAGVIVAYLVRRDEHHEWARAQFQRFPHFDTCDAALAEACARLQYYDLPPWLVVDLVREGALRPALNFRPAADRVAALMQKYADQPMDLADACLVVMAENERDSLVVTTDGDFKVYRRFGREAIPRVDPYS